MEAICASETSVNFHRTTGLYITEDRTLHSHRCENLKFTITAVCLHYADLYVWRDDDLLKVETCSQANHETLYVI
jgi:hypothetical protein